MRVIHILLIFLNILYVGGLDIFITTPVKIIDCRTEIDESPISDETTTHTHTYEEIPVDPKEFYEAAGAGDIGYITTAMALGDRSSSSNSRLRRLLTWRNQDIVFNDTALHVAAEEGHGPVVLALLDAGASPNVKNYFGETPMHRAGKGDYGPVVLALLEAGASPNVKDNYRGMTPVHIAAQLGNTSVLRDLLQPKYQAQVNIQDKDGRTPVYWAATNGHPGNLELLLAHGGDVHMAKHFSRSPLMEASSKGNVGAAQVLINAGARVGDTNKWGNTALYIAAVTNHIDIARLLLENGADKSHPDNYGTTPLRAAKIHNHIEVADLIDNWQ